jgi:hypothetical protein
MADDKDLEEAKRIMARMLSMPPSKEKGRPEPPLSERFQHWNGSG